MWKFGAVTQGFYWHGRSAGAQPVTCTEDKGGNASPWLLAKRRSHEGGWRQRGGDADRRNGVSGWWIQFNHLQGKKFKKQKKSWLFFFFF